MPQKCHFLTIVMLFLGPIDLLFNKVEALLLHEEQGFNSYLSINLNLLLWK